MSDTYTPTPIVPHCLDNEYADAVLRVTDARPEDNLLDFMQKMLTAFDAVTELRSSEEDEQRIDHKAKEYAKQKALLLVTECQSFVGAADTMGIPMSNLARILTFGLGSPLDSWTRDDWRICELWIIEGASIRQLAKVMNVSFATARKIKIWLPSPEDEQGDPDYTGLC